MLDLFHTYDWLGNVRELRNVRGNRKRAAEMLGISLRTLQNRIALLRKEEKAAMSDS